MKSKGNSKPKILVVDDEPDNLDLLYRTFYREYKVLKATSGPAALDLLSQEGEVAVIISDQRMPMMSGTEFLSLTATQYPDIIRIILTGYTDVEDLVEAINSGKVFKYVTKPWEAEELQVVVRQALDTHNVLKARTRELTRTLRQESLLNTVTNTIRSALDYRQILQTIVDTVGHMLEVDVCLLRPFQDGQLSDEGFIYQQATAVGNRVTVATPAENNQLEYNQLEYNQLEYNQLENNLSAYNQPENNQNHLQQNIQSINQDPSNQDSSYQDRNLTTNFGSENFAGTNPFGQTIWETRDVQIINDVTIDERLTGDTPEQQKRAEAFSEVGIRSTLVVPLILRQELMAVLALHQCHEPRAWSEDEVQLVMMVADQAALALSQAYAYEQVRSLAQREALVNTITTAIRSSLDPQDIFAAITQQLGQALQVDGCVLSLWTEEDEYVQCVGLYDTEKGTPTNHNHFLPQSQAPIKGNLILQEVLRTQEPVIISDMSNCPPELSGLELPLRGRSRSLMVVPLLADGKSIGSITLRQEMRARNWQTPEIELAKTVAA